ncbi:MAG: hypothetical protein IJH77_05940 [Mogibacterium sp.]|nr:hypothetical protein [Mogibacterium sp.]
MRFFTRSRTVRPRMYATPYSVTTISAAFLGTETTAPGVRVALILEIVPPLAVEAIAMMLRPPLECIAPKAKSNAPPVPENCIGPMDSEQICPVRSISIAVLTETMLSICAMTHGSLV